MSVGYHVAAARFFPCNLQPAVHAHGSCVIHSRHKRSTPSTESSRGPTNLDEHTTDVVGGSPRYRQECSLIPGPEPDRVIRQPRHPRTVRAPPPTTSFYAAAGSESSTSSSSLWPCVLPSGGRQGPRGRARAAETRTGHQSTIASQWRQKGNEERRGEPKSLSPSEEKKRCYGWTTAFWIDSSSFIF